MTTATIRNLGAAFAEFQAHPSAAMWTYLTGQMTQYQSEWNDQDEADAKTREETRQALCRLNDYEYNTP